MFFSKLRKDIAAAQKNDPAARNKFEILLTYSGVHALSWHRWANFLYRIRLKLLARMTSQFAKFWIDLKSIDLKPGAPVLKLDTSKETDLCFNVNDKLERTEPFSPMW